MSKIKDTDYLTISARIRARETRLLTRERMERMLDARSGEERAKVLAECGYPELSALTGRGLDAAARAVVQEAGFGAYFTHSFGHSLGLEIHESPNASPGEERTLPAGTVISAEPGIYLPGRFGVRIEDVLVLEENGCEDLTQSPKNLIVL